MNPKALGDVRNVAFLREVMPVLDAKVEEMVKALENRVYMDLQQGILTPERALEAWIEKLSYRKLISKLDQSLKMGQYQGEKLASELEAAGKKS